MQTIPSLVRNRFAMATFDAFRVAGTRSITAPTTALIASGFLVFAVNAAGNTFIVDTNGDPGLAGTQSLRQAIGSANASPGNSIQFSNTLNGSTITLANGEIAITQAMNIVGPGADKLTLSGNDATRIFLVSAASPVVISGITLTHAYVAPPLAGAAIGAFNSSVYVHDSVISHSRSKAGGGIFAMDSTVSITDSHITENSSTYSGAGVFAMCAGNCNAAVSILRSTITGNVAGQSGAGLYAYRMRDVTIEQSLFSANRCTPPLGQRGGAIFFFLMQHVPKIVNSTITGNFSPSTGGGLYADTAYVAFSTIAKNATNSDSSNGIFAVPGGSVTLQDTIVANNVNATSLSDLAGTIAANFSLIKSPGSASLFGTGSIIGVDPQLGALANHGGATATMVPAPSSPAVNAGEMTPVFGIDQRGLPRPVSTNADIGAVERQTLEDIIFRDGFAGF